MDPSLKYDAEQNRFSWIGEETKLKEFVENLAGNHEGWNGGRWEVDRSRNMHTYKTSRIVVKWYSSTKTVLLQGKDHELMRTKLLNHIQPPDSIEARCTANQDVAILCASEVSNNNLENADNTIHGDAVSERVESSDEESDNESSGDEDSEVLDKLNFICSTIKLVKSDVESLKETFQAKPDKLETSNAALMSENYHLNLRVNLLERNLHDPLGVNQENHISERTNIQISRKEVNTQQRSRVTVGFSPGSHSPDNLQLLHEQEQQVSPNVDPSTSYESPSRNGPERERITSTTKANQPKPDSKVNNSSVIIIGDSIIKNIDPKKLSKKRVHKCSYPGKTTEQISHEITNLKINTSPSHVIIHAGTNNLVTTDSPNSCAIKIEKLATKIQQKFPQAKIAISGLTSREDVDVSTKLDSVNSELRSIAKKHGFYFVDNCIIDSSCLKRSTLHLNPKGSALLAVQFIKFLRSNGHHHGSAGTSTKRVNSRRDFQQMSTLQQLGNLLMNLGSIQPQFRRGRDR